MLLNTIYGIIAVCSLVVIVTQLRAMFTKGDKFLTNAFFIAIYSWLLYGCMNHNFTTVVWLSSIITGIFCVATLGLHWIIRDNDLKYAGDDHGDGVGKIVWNISGRETNHRYFVLCRAISAVSIVLIGLLIINQ